MSTAFGEVNGSNERCGTNYFTVCERVCSKNNKQPRTTYIHKHEAMLMLVGRRSDGTVHRVQRTQNVRVYETEDKMQISFVFSI